MKIINEILQFGDGKLSDKNIIKSTTICGWNVEEKKRGQNPREKSAAVVLLSARRKFIIQRKRVVGVIKKEAEKTFSPLTDFNLSLKRL